MPSIALRVSMMQGDQAASRSNVAYVLREQGDLEAALPLFADIFARGENWRELTPRLVPGGLLQVDEAQLATIMAQGR